MRHSVLLVDDDHAIRALLRLFFERAGFTVAEAEDGRQALDRIDAEFPEAVVLDIMMPVMDGLQVLGHLHAAGRVPQLPVLVLTANPAPDLPSRVMALGARGLMRKPMSPSALVARIRETIEQ